MLAYGFTLLLVVGTLLVFAAASLVDTSRGTDEANAAGLDPGAQPARRASPTSSRRTRGFEGLDTTSPFDGARSGSIDAEEPAMPATDGMEAVGSPTARQSVVFAVDENGGRRPAATTAGDAGIGFLWPLGPRCLAVHGRAVRHR